MYICMYECMNVCMCCMYPYYLYVMGRVGMEFLLVYTYIIKYFFNIIVYMRYICKNKH